MGPTDSFSDLANAIDLHFARWDLGHLHLFTLQDGREIGEPDPESPEWLDHDRMMVTKTLFRGDQFEYVFDLGDEWVHHCRVEEAGIDPTEILGEIPESPIPVWGWGWIPDQYGRRSESD